MPASSSDNLSSDGDPQRQSLTSALISARGSRFSESPLSRSSVPRGTGRPAVTTRCNSDSVARMRIASPFQPQPHVVLGIDVPLAAEARDSDQLYDSAGSHDRSSSTPGSGGRCCSTASTQWSTAAAAPSAAAVARAFAREGATVHLAGRTLATSNRWPSTSAPPAAGHDRGGRRLDEQAVDAHADRVAAEHGCIDISMNLISIDDVQGTPLVEMRLDDFEQPISNALRTTFLTSGRRRHMIRQGSGVILMFGGDGDPIRDYNIGGFQISLDRRRVVAPAAGERARPPRRPRRLAADRRDHRPDGGRLRGPRRLVESLVAPTMLGRGAVLEDVGNVAVFAASDLARTITASAINISCGAIVGVIEPAADVGRHGPRPSPRRSPRRAARRRPSLPDRVCSYTARCEVAVPHSAVDHLDCARLLAGQRSRIAAAMAWVGSGAGVPRPRELPRRRNIELRDGDHLHESSSSMRDRRRHSVVAQAAGVRSARG